MPSTELTHCHSGLISWRHRTDLAPSICIKQHHLQATCTIDSQHITAGIILWMHPANVRRCYNVKSSLIGWVHSKDDPCCMITRQIWGIWKLRPAYSPETPNLGQNRWCFVPCDLEIWWMTLENNRASPLCCFKLGATFHSHWWIQTGVTVRKRPIWVKFEEF